MDVSCKQHADILAQIMLRNIPNKIDQVDSSNSMATWSTANSMEAMLKEIVDETSLGKYDFMYLRIGMLL